MIKIYISTLFSFLIVELFAQNNPTAVSRSNLDPLLAPFYHGVASGDPMHDRVIIWTRLTPDESGTYEIAWRVATDTLMQNVIASGSAFTSDEKDYTVKIDVTGLQADSWYYYDFQIDGFRSLIGRTKTTPLSPNGNKARLAVVSCADYQNGYYNAYRDIAQRNEVEAVIHLGDYIYEYAASSSINRTHEPENETITLEDYRTRYSHYRLDPDLRFLHQQLPFICVWDDHESANNAWNGGAQNHTPATEGNWFERKTNSIQANEEWLPIRKPDANNSERIYRKLSYGGLFDLFMLDTRLIGRDEQGSGAANNRKLLGEVQFEWLMHEMQTSNAQWKIIGQQVMMAPLLAFGIAVNNDQWDGYPGERQALLQEITTKNINNVVVLTGDIHTSWANDVPFGSYNNSNLDAVTGSAMVEFITTSITSQSLPLPLPLSLIQSQNRHVRWADLTRKGYFILDITSDKVQADYVFVSTIANQQFSTSFGAHWFVNNNERFLRQTNQATLPNAQAPLAPLLPIPTSINEKNPLASLVGIYPNPFEDKLLLQFNLFEPQRVQLALSDLNGKIVWQYESELLNQGLHYLEIFPENINKGLYIFQLKAPNLNLSRKVFKL